MRLPDMGAWRKLAERYFAPAWKVDHPVEVECGEGVHLVDRQGNRYVDFTSGYGPTLTGHCHPRVVKAIRHQAGRLIHTATTVYNEPVVRAAEAVLAVASIGGDPMIHFMNSGAEAVEAAMKLSRLATGRPAFIAFRGAFHGRTLGALSLTTSKGLYRDCCEPLVPGVYFAPYPYPFRSPFGQDPEACAQGCLAEVELLFEHIVPPRQVAAMFVEPVLGEGGYVPPPISFLQGLRRLCDAHDILLVADEVQSGFGRSGRWFAIEHAGVEPDIMVIAKALASGMPLSALIARREIAQKWSPGAHGTTYGGNPIACAAALATLDIIREEGLVENAVEQGAFLLSELRALQQEYPMMGDVRGRGLMIGIEFVQDEQKTPWPEAVQQVVAECRARGVLLAACGPRSQVVRLLPPLILTREQAEYFLEIFADAVASVTR